VIESDNWIPEPTLNCTISQLLIQEAELNTLAYRLSLFAMLDLPDAGRVLDAGCGAGFLSRLIAEHKPQCAVYGIDLDSKMLQLAEFRTAHLKPRPLFLQDDVLALRFPDRYFDRVVCQLLLCNLPDPRLALQELLRVLKPGGQLVCIEPVNEKAVLTCAHVPWTKIIQQRWQREMEALTLKGLDVNLGKRLCTILPEFELQSVRVAGCAKASEGVGFLPLAYYKRIAHSPDDLIESLERILGQSLGQELDNELRSILVSEDKHRLMYVSFGSLVAIPLLIVGAQKP